jgi:hypothetical protein
MKTVVLPRLTPRQSVKHAIHFYALARHKYCYLSSMFENGGGNSTDIEAVHDYY